MGVPRVKFGLFVPAAMHARLKAACGANGVSDGYARAFGALLNQLDAGEAVTFPAVRGPKTRASIRLDAEGMISSFMNIFAPSAKGCRMPKGPARLGPILSWKKAATLRSA